MRAMAPGGGRDAAGAGRPVTDIDVADARVWETIARPITQPDFFARQGERDPCGVGRLWARLESRTTHRMVDEYAAALEDPAALLYGPGLPSPLRPDGHRPEAHAVATFRLAHAREAGDPARAFRRLWPF